MPRYGECLLCVEEFAWLRPTSCCEKDICQRCLYQHIQSILEEARTGGRRRIVCPFGCGTEISDFDIRLCFHRQHYSVVWDFIGTFLYIILGGWLVPKRPYDYGTCRHYFYWINCLHTRGERRDLEAYERWNVLTAYAEMNKKHDAVIVHCPAADCDYSWIVADPEFRRKKQQHEEKTRFMWYTPMKPEPVPTTWVEPHLLNIEVTGWIQQIIDDPGNDARRMICGKCAHVFCGLCRNPWIYENHRHIGYSCRSFARKLPRGWDHQDMASWGSTRACPGCQLRTTRISGCNHMTCPCGYEWCYVCRGSWNSLHYSCFDGQPTSCIVS